MIKRKGVFFILFLFLSTFLFSQNSSKIERGVLDLREWNFKENGNVELKGQWEFYWGKLYTPEDFDDEVHTPDAYVDVPGSWSGTIVNGEKISDTGYATYRLVIFVKPDSETNYMLRLGEILTAYNVWWNDKHIVNIGNVSDNSYDAKPALKPIIRGVDFDKERIQILVQVSNYNHRSNGFFQVPIIGEEDKIVRSFSLFMFFDIIIFGAVLIMALYHIGLYILRTKNKAALAFALLSIVVGVRTLFSGNYTISLMFPNISWELIYRINYFTFYSLVATFIFFFRATFDEKKYKLIFYLGYGFSALFTLTLILPTLVYSSLLVFYQVIVVFLVSFCAYLLVKYAKEKRTGVIILSITIIIFFLSGINDILFFNGIINITTLSHLGLFVLILGQSLTLAGIFNKAFADNEKLTAKLDYQNQHLQELVGERTKEIEAQKQDILQKNEELQVQKEELQVQKDEIVRQKDLLENHNRFVTDSINYASTIQKAVLPANDKVKEYFNSFLIFMPRDIVSGDFYWFSDSNPDYIYLGVGDCTGHGVPGAFLSLIGIYLLNTIVVEKQVTDPKEIICSLDKLFNEFLHKGLTDNRDGMEIGLFRFEKSNLKKMIYSAAKTNMFIYNHDKKTLDRYRGARRSVGLINTHSTQIIKFENMEMNLDEQITIYCATDGFVDQNNPERKRFGSHKFVEMLKEIAELPMQQQKISIIRRFEEYQKGELQRDDVTVIGISPK